MKSTKLTNTDLSSLVQEHISANGRIEEMEQQLKDVDSLIERFESGEEITEDELNELMGGLGAIGKWGAQKAKSAMGSAGKAIGQAASDVKHQYQKGQRASAIDKQRKTVDKQQVANNEKVMNLASQGKTISAAIKRYQSALAQIGAEYQKLTGKEYTPGRAIANAQRYVAESQKKK